MRRAALLLLLCTSAYLLIALGLAISRAEVLEQDGAYYCEVASRLVDGHGLTSLSDRRGPASAIEFPVPYRASTLWPVLLAPFVAITGEARYTGAIISLLALVAALWLGTAAVRDGSGAVPAVVALCVIAAMTQRKFCEAAVAPMTDCLSIAATAAVLWAIVGRRWLVSLLLLALAVAVRFQNLALLLPALMLLPAGRARRGALIAAIVTATAAVVWRTSGHAFEGLGVFVNPAERDSLLRAVRFLTLPMLVGIVLARGDQKIAPFGLMAIGHLLVLLANYDSSDGRPWLFAGRHGMPFHLAASAYAAYAIHGSRGWLRLAVLILVAIAFGENISRPAKVCARIPDVTARPDVVLGRDYLRQHPLPDEAVMLCHDCDVFARELQIRGVHLRGHLPDPPADKPSWADYLEQRSISHVLLSWQESPFVAAQNEWMSQLEQRLTPCVDVVADLHDDDSGARALLLRLRR